MLVAAVLAFTATLEVALEAVELPALLVSELALEGAFELALLACELVAFEVAEEVAFELALLLASDEVALEATLLACELAADEGALDDAAALLVTLAELGALLLTLAAFRVTVDPALEVAVFAVVSGVAESASTRTTCVVSSVVANESVAKPATNHSLPALYK